MAPESGTLAVAQRLAELRDHVDRIAAKAERLERKILVAALATGDAPEP